MEYWDILHLIPAMDFLTTCRPEINFAVQAHHLEEKVAILHCTLKIDLCIRMWPDTYLVQDNGNRKKLIHVFNIGFYPETIVAAVGYNFTLVFEGLDAECKKFDLIEHAQEKGGFIIKNIKRNSTDIYPVFIGRENLQSF